MAPNSKKERYVKTASLLLVLVFVLESGAQNIGSVINNVKNSEKTNNKVLPILGGTTGEGNLTLWNMEASSKMAWFIALFDQHKWEKHLTNASSSCKEEMFVYLKALNRGQLWASKMFDASGHYSQTVLFGNDFMLGSQYACKDLQLKKYYDDIPPYDTSFHVARLNVTLKDGHIPQSRTFLLGLCLPSSCKADDISMILNSRASAHLEKSREDRIEASLLLLGVRPVPGAYTLLGDSNFVILGSITLTIAILMLVASICEGYLEGQARVEKMKRCESDLEMSNQNNNHSDILHKNNNEEIKVITAEHHLNHGFVQNGKSVPTFPNGRPDTPSEDIAENRGTRFTWYYVTTWPITGEAPAQWLNITGFQIQVKGILLEILLSFSVLSNGRKILSTNSDTSEDTLTCIHGLRFFSVIWVIMVHTYLSLFSIADNKTMRTVTERNFLYQSVGNASYSVDTFFFISGLLVTILFLRTEDKKSSNSDDETSIKGDTKSGYDNAAMTNSSLSVISHFERDLMDTKDDDKITMKEFCYNLKKFLLLILYRLIRLTPAYWFVIGANEIAMRHIYNKTVFDAATADHVTCDLFWWRNVLYINNLYPLREMCMVWSWYMANDTQFYVVGILLLLISVRFFKFAAISGTVLMVSSWLTTIYISYSYQYKARIQDPFEMFDPLYDKPWSRLGPYLIGMITGWYLHKRKCKVDIPYWVSLICWPISIAIMGVLIFGMVDGYFEVWPTAFYVSVGHTGWGVAVAWITLACCTGHGGLVNSILSYGGLLPLSRLTYCAYLVHPMIMIYYSYHMDGPIRLQQAMITAYAGFAVMSFVISFFISLSYEAPVVRLMKIIVTGNGKRRNKND